MTSIRLYLVIVLLSTICLVNFVAALHGYRSSMAQADKLLDRQLTDSANLLAKLEFTDIGRQDSRDFETLSSETRHPQLIYPQTMMFQIWQGGRLLERSSNAPQALILPLELGFHIKNHQGLHWRILVQQSDDTPADASRWIIVGQSADAYTTLIEGVIFQSIWPIIWVLPILGVAIWLIVGLGLRPLRQLAKLLEQRKTDELSPLQASGYPGELTTLVESTNSLLTRLSEAFEREKRFASDAAHELRTPLAVLKVNLHNIAEEVGIDNASLQELEASVDRMGHSIEQILALYRLTPDKFYSTLSWVDISALARESIAELYPKCQNKNQQITLDAQPQKIECDAFAISTLLRNLIDNASKYTPTGGSIAVSVSFQNQAQNQQAQNQQVIVAVEDSGPGIPHASLERVFDRFYRVGGDHHSSGVVGCGLGLSIVEHIVHLHHGQIELGQSKELGGLRVSVVLPCQHAVRRGINHG
ncbi:MAG: sensor histidine kinase N-terminal domain-containing protein [Porticoccaceae bacterium]|nr:sensor histidine kinase N-terminal domain-containing protein [Porticoccaceae bacterium]